MNWRRRILYRLRGVLTDLAHGPWALRSRWHDRLEFIAYRIVDSWIWK